MDEMTQAEPIEPGRFRQVMARMPAGVTVITTLDAAGCPWGFTASSFTPLSLDPPLVLFCLDRTASSWSAFNSSSHFAVSFLGEEHEHVARRFAQRDPGKFADIPFRMDAIGLPLLVGAVGSVTCELDRRFPGGDHTIFVGRVIEAELGPGAPMVYCDRSYAGVNEALAGLAAAPA